PKLVLIPGASPRLNCSSISGSTIRAHGLPVSPSASISRLVPSAATSIKRIHGRSGEPLYGFRCSAITLLAERTKKDYSRIGILNARLDNQQALRALALDLQLL